MSSPNLLRSLMSFGSNQEAQKQALRKREEQEILDLRRRSELEQARKSSAETPYEKYKKNRMAQIQVDLNALGRGDRNLYSMKDKSPEGVKKHTLALQREYDTLSIGPY